MAGVEVRRFADLAASVFTLPPSCGPARVVAIDGPGGSGKSTFADRLAAAVAPHAEGGRVPVVHTDDFASWENQFGWAPLLREAVIDPLRRGVPGRYRRYDWVRRQFAEWHEVQVAPALIIEGVGAAQAHFADALAFAIWVDTPPEVRLARGLARDGEQLRSFWQQWIIGENAHYAADDTRSRADLVVVGDPAVPHDPRTEFVTRTST